MVESGFDSLVDLIGRSAWQIDEWKRNTYMFDMSTVGTKNIIFEYIYIHQHIYDFHRTVTGPEACKDSFHELPSYLYADSAYHWPTQPFGIACTTSHPSTSLQQSNGTTSSRVSSSRVEICPWGPQSMRCHRSSTHWIRFMSSRIPSLEENRHIYPVYLSLGFQGVCYKTNRLFVENVQVAGYSSSMSLGFKW